MRGSVGGSGRGGGKGEEEGEREGEKRGSFLSITWIMYRYYMQRVCLSIPMHIYAHTYIPIHFLPILLYKDEAWVRGCQV